ncbi:MAG: VWA domain-containing protein [Thermoanaerobaculia bacterium]
MQNKNDMRKRQLFVNGLVLALVASAVAASVREEIAMWPEHQRSFVQDGTVLLLDRNEKKELLEASSADRDRLIEEFFDQDPFPDTPENELLQAIDRRQQLVHQEFLTMLDDRARVLFLRGPPVTRNEVECGMTFKPIEIWTYGPESSTNALLFYRPAKDRPYRLWMPMETKRVLFTAEMEYWMEQWEELRGVITAKRIDLQQCPAAREVDDATGIRSLRDFQRNRPTNEQVARYLQPPSDLAAWVQYALTTPLEVERSRLVLEGPEVFFPDRLRQRMVTLFLVAIPPENQLEPSAEGEKRELILSIDGLIEQEGQLFDEIKVRYKLEPPAEAVHIALAFERALRPDREFVIHLRVRDEVGGGEGYLHRGFRVPTEPKEMELPPVPEGTVIAMGEQLERVVIAGKDDLLLIPPAEDVVVGFWRAEALVTGERIQKVAFLVDGQRQMTRSGRPFSAELRLAPHPTEQLVRAEGYDQAGELVASDEVVLNQPRGALRVRILEPIQGSSVSGRILSTAEVVVPEESRVEEVEFLVNEQSVAKLKKPPWQAEIDVPASGAMAYLTVMATLDDGSRAEEVRFLNAPQYLEEVDVNLVELYTTVTDRSGDFARDLVQEDFEVSEDGRPQTVSKFELVVDLPLTIGFVIDTSGSMADSLPEAKKAALGFLDSILTPRDQAFAVAFADKPVLIMPRTDDVSALEESFEDLRSLGWTTLHDAIATGLYYFRGIRGRRALILLSDGDDTGSSIPYRDALEYARRSGVAIYSVGLNVGKLSVGIRRKLTNLAEETGGQVFFIGQAEELVGVYDEIEEELRSQYLLAYTSDMPNTDGTYREVEVKVKKGGLKARTIRGYYP